SRVSRERQDRKEGQGRNEKMRSWRSLPPLRPLRARPAAALKGCATIIALLCLFAAPAAAQSTRLLVITGVPGDEEHEQRFRQWATSVIDTAKKKESLPDANITFLSGSKANKEGIDKAFTDLAARSKPNDTIVILLIGHGSFDGRTAAFNI